MPTGKPAETQLPASGKNESERTNNHFQTTRSAKISAAFFFCRRGNITHLFKLSSDAKIEENPLIRGRYLVSEMLQELREDFVPSSRNALMRATEFALAAISHTQT